MNRLFAIVILAGLVQTTLAEPPPKARFVDNKVFVQIRVKATDAFEEKSGCTFFGPQGSSVGNGSLTCGYPGSVSEVTWKHVKTTEDGDVYVFTRRFPTDGEAPKAQTKEVVYRGNEVVVFEDKWQRIGMAPKSAK